MKYMSEVIYLKNTFFTCSSMLKLLNVLERHMLVTQLCLTFCNSMDCSPPGSSVHGILQARILEWVAISFSEDLPNLGIEPRSPALQADSLPTKPLGSCKHNYTLFQKSLKQV